jgi:hypothetical protein
MKHAASGDAGLEAAVTAHARSEAEYEAFLDRWGLTREDVERASRGEHLVTARSRLLLERALAEVDAATGEPAAPRPVREPAVPPHAIKI